METKMFYKIRRLKWVYAPIKQFKLLTHVLHSNGKVNCKMGTCVPFEKHFYCCVAVKCLGQMSLMDHCSINQVLISFSLTKSLLNCH